jgi:hypothetical protein
MKRMPIWALAGLLAVAPLEPLQSKDKHGRRAGTVVAVSIFTGPDVEIIRGYWRGDRSGLPPGLAKRNSLPPGLAKQLYRNGRLPPGLEKRLVYFPAELEVRLAPVRPGLRRCFLDGRALIINPKTRVIVDVLVLD